MCPRSQKRRGFTLIEAIVAVFILLVGVLSVYGMFPTAANAVTTARNTYSATELAREKLEYWVQQGYSVIQPSATTLESDTLVYTDLSNGITQTWNLTCQVTHTPLCSNGASPPCGVNPEIAERVEAFVTWQPKGWSSASVEYVRLDTLIISGWQTP